jgi:DNA gyrase subunit A
MLARATIEPMDSGRNSIIVTELPYQVNKATLVENIADMAREKRIDGISDLRDESDRNGMRIVIELRRDANANVVLNFLYKHTAMRSSFGMNCLAIVGGQPKILTFKNVLEEFIKHREDVIQRRSKFQLRKAEARAHILEGFRAILASIDDVIALIRSSQSREDARNKLMNQGVPAYVDGARATDGQMVTLSEIQANAVLDMRLGQLTQLDRMKIDDEYADLIKEIERLRGILESVQKVRQLIKADMARIKKEYGNARRTQVYETEVQNFNPEDFIANEEVVVTITRDGYIKKLPKDTYAVQNRGGRGKVGLTKKEEDSVEHLFTCSTHNILLVFTNRGRVFQLKGYEVPTASRQAKGTPIVQMLQVEKGEVVTAVLNVSDFEGEPYLFMVTREGTVKKTSLSDYANRRTGGLIAINLDGKDELRFVFETDGKKEIILASRQSKAVRFNESAVRPTSRNTMGVRGMTLEGKDDYIVGAAVASPEEHVLTVSELGKGKRSRVDEYPVRNRGGKGVLTMKEDDATGELVSLQVVKPGDELMIITSGGVVIRQKVDDIREISRNTKGVKLINLDNKDKVAAVAKLLHDADGADGEDGEEIEEVSEAEADEIEV